MDKKATITIDVPNQPQQQFESENFVLIAKRGNGCQNTIYINGNTITFLNIVCAMDNAREKILNYIAEDLGGGRRVTAIKITGTAKEVSFTLQHMAAWFGGKTAVASVPPKSLKAFQSKFYRKEVTTNGNTRY